MVINLIGYKKDTFDVEFFPKRKPTDKNVPKQKNKESRHYEPNLVYLGQDKPNCPIRTRVIL